MQPLGPDQPAAEGPLATRRRFLLLGGAAAVGGGTLGLAALRGCRPDAPPGGPVVRSSPGAASESPPPPPPELEPEPDFRVPPPDEEPDIRVRIGRLASGAAAISLGSARQWLRLRAMSGADPWGVVLRGPIELALDRAGVRIIDAGGFIPRPQPGAALRLEAISRDQPSIIVDGVRYPGSLALVPRSEDGDANDDDGDDGGGEAGARLISLDLVNHLPLETYLPGVLAKELYRHWHAEAFIAQAIAARSFAICEIHHRRERRHFDVSDTQSSQAYIGATDHAQSNEATRTTRGRVVEYGGSVVPAYYSSCCGGMAACALHAIGPNPLNALDPLNVPAARECCRHAPLYAWERTRQVDELAARVSAYGRSRGLSELAALGRLRAIEPTFVGINGRVLALRLADEKGRVANVSAERFRFAANHRSNDLPKLEHSLPSSNVSAQFRAGEVRFTGHGYGHGVGLCQHGAQALASGGQSGEAIIAQYYPGGTIIESYR